MDFITAPFALVLRFFSEELGNYGLALIALAVMITLIRIPFDIKGKRGTMKTSLIQPELQAIREKHASNPTKMNQELQKLYQERGVKPLGGCVWAIFPMVIILILFQIIRQPLTHLMSLDQYQIDLLRAALNELPNVYPPIEPGGLYQVRMAGYLRDNFDYLRTAVPEVFQASQIFPINMNFLGLNLGGTPRWQTIFEGGTLQDFGLMLLPVFSMAAAYVSQKVMTATNYMTQPAQQAQMMKTMMLMMPLMSLFIGFTFPAAMSLYWTVSSLTFALASLFINRHFGKVYKEMRAEMDELERQKQAELEAKRKRTEALRAQGATQENKGTSKKKKQIQDREKERQRQAANRAAEREDEAEEENLSREGHRKFARGRAYDPERFEGAEDEAAEEAEELTEALEAQVYEAEDDVYEVDDDDYYDDYDDEDDDEDIDR